jgi:hypothetical protein
MSNPAMDALKEYLQLRDEIAELEKYYNDSCSCDANEFHRCEFCDNVGTKEDHKRMLLTKWGDSWAVMLSEVP